MYLRDAKKHEEVWLLDRLEEFGFEDPAFRSRDYVFAIDEETGEKAGFGRLRVHSIGEEEYCELTCIGVREEFRGRGVGAHVIERLTELARDQGFDRVLTFSPMPGYCRQFGFVGIDEAGLPEKLKDRLQRLQESDEAVTPMAVDVAALEVPPRLRRRFDDVDTEEREGERPEDFGIDPETAKYKYSTGR